MASTRAEWAKSERPAYGNGKNDSIDLNYKYSAADCQVTPEERYRLNNVKLIDFWGEGYIRTQNPTVITGFKDAYNINHQYQLVSNGPNRGRKIPNRIPVRAYDNYDLKPYIKDSAARYVTLMGAPMNDNAYMEISRILRKEDGVFVYFSHESEDDLSSKTHAANRFFNKNNFIILGVDVYKKIERNLEFNSVSIPIGFVYMAADKILSYIKSNSSDFSSAELANVLYSFYNCELTKLWKDALKHLTHSGSDTLLLSALNALCMDKTHYDCVSQFVNYMKEEVNIFFYIQESGSKYQKYQYLYTFFEERERNMTKILFGGKYATITNLEFDMPLKLPKKMVDINKDKPAFGGSPKRGIETDSKNRFYWKLERVKHYGADFYTLTNLEYNMPLKLPVKMIDKDGDKPAYGGSADRKIERNQERRFYWYIQAIGDYETV